MIRNNTGRHCEKPKTLYGGGEIIKRRTIKPTGSAVGPGVVREEVHTLCEG